MTRILQIGSSYACAQAALLLHYFGAEVFTFVEDVEEVDGSRSSQILRDCLTFGKRLVDAKVESLSAAVVQEILGNVDLVLDDHPLAYWLERGFNLRHLYLEQPPRAHWLAITPYGLAGAGDAWPGCELTEQASGPMMYRVGEAGRSPLPIKGAHAEAAAAWHAALLSSAAIFGQRTGTPGALLDVSIQECQYMHSELGTSNWHFNGIEVRRSETARHSPSVYQALDGNVYMMFLDREWPRVARMIGRPDLDRDERFMARYQRTQHLEELDTLLTPWFLERTALQAVEAGQAVGMPIALGQTAIDALADPQLLFRKAFETVPSRTADMVISFPTGIGKFSEPGIPRMRVGQSALPISLTSLVQELSNGRPPRTNIDGERCVREQDPAKPLAGVRVIDLANTWAGPRGAMLLGDLGAEVIKLDGVEWMDVLRGFTEPPDGNSSYPHGVPGDRPWDRYIMWLGGPGRNKRSLAAELTRPEARAILDELIAISDVVVTNMSAPTRAKYRLDFATLSQINPRVVFATLSGYGDAGPRSHWRLFGDGQASMAGLFVGTGYAGEDSLPLGTIGDPINGTALAFQIVEALLMRERSGKGIHIDVSAVESCLSYGTRSFIEAQIGEDCAATVGFDSRGRWPHGIFRCLGEDSWVAISCGSPEERQALLEGLRPLGADLGRLFAAVGGENEAGTAWNRLLAEACEQREPETLEKALRSRGVPCQKVMRGRDIDGDACLASRRFISWLWREDLGSYPSYSPAWIINGERPSITNPSPRLGQDNRYALHSLLGKEEAQLAQLWKHGVIGDKPLAGAELGIRPIDEPARGES